MIAFTRKHNTLLYTDKRYSCFITSIWSQIGTQPFEKDWIYYAVIIDCLNDSINRDSFEFEETAINWITHIIETR